MAKKNKQTLNLFYDKDADVLYLSFGEPRAAISEETKDGIIIRYDINTKDVIGYTIYNYARKVKRNSFKDISQYKNLTLPDIDSLNIEDCNLA